MKEKLIVTIVTVFTLIWVQKVSANWYIGNSCNYDESSRYSFLRSAL